MVSGAFVPFRSADALNHSSGNLDSFLNIAEAHCCLVQEMCFLAHNKRALCLPLRGSHTNGHLAWRPALRGRFRTIAVKILLSDATKGSATSCGQ
ncbi:hypothetical protein TNCV_4495661 [Trichonephila clavipes]|nr:hypothetical protein TNCV_4495661 [Trichonephila clavipes]